jgi:hypothetical protein
MKPTWALRQRVRARVARRRRRIAGAVLSFGEGAQEPSLGLPSEILTAPELEARIGRSGGWAPERAPDDESGAAIAGAQITICPL